MIVRPQADSKLIALIAEILSDTTIPMDARAILATLLARRDLAHCPVRGRLAELIGVGPYRLKTIIRGAVASGYMVRATGYVPRKRGHPLYTFVVGARGPAVGTGGAAP